MAQSSTFDAPPTKVDATRVIESETGQMQVLQQVLHYLYWSGPVCLRRGTFGQFARSRHAP